MALGWAPKTQRDWVETLTLAEILQASEEQAAAALALVVCNHSGHSHRKQRAHNTEPESVRVKSSSPELLRGLMAVQ